MTASLRPDWTTVTRRDLRQRPVAYPAKPGTCPHGVEVDVNEPLVLLGSQVVQEPDGTKHVDLSGAEWHPQTCLGGGS